MNDPLLLILNPKSGSSGPEFRAQIEAELQERGATYEIRETTLERGADILAQEAVKEGATHLIACGGDGTIMRAINGLAKMEKAAREPNAEPEVTFSIIPGGTANLLATALGIPHDVEKAVEIALVGREKIVDLGQCGDELFALGMGLGLTERLVSQASTKDKEKLGRLAYLKAMLRELGARPHSFSFQLDDGKEQLSRGVAVVIANSGDIGGRLQFAPDAEMDDGKLDLCVLHRFYFRDLVRMIWNSLLGKMDGDRAVSFFQAAKIEIKSDPPLDLQIDGEEVEMQTPLVAQVRPRALKVRVPEQDEHESGIVETVEVMAERKPWILMGSLLAVGAVLVWQMTKRKKRIKH